MERKNNRELNRFLERIDNLHSSPSVACQVLALSRRDDFNVDDLASCLQNDPALTARLLQVVNSPRYGLARKATSVRHAVILLGQRSLRMLVMTFSLLDRLTKGDLGSLYQNYWKRSLTIASVASRLADRIDGSRDDAYTAGLLADIGILALAQVYGESYADVCREAIEADELLVAERNRFGFDHAAAGSYLLARWGFPRELIDAIVRHHEPVAMNDTVVDAVAGANQVAEVLWNTDGEKLRDVRAMLYHRFDIDTDAFIDLVMQAKEDVRLNAESFQIRLDETFDCQAILEQARRQLFDASFEAALDLDSLSAAFDDRSA